MTNIGLLSDTHGYLNKELFNFFKDCDEIWHAGDMGPIEIADVFKGFKIRAVYGNMDDSNVRSIFPAIQRFFCEVVDVLMTHIGGYPGNYSKEIKSIIHQNPPKLLISGHSHILKVMYDKKMDLLFINPGAAGKSGLHKLSTAVRFVIKKDNISDLEIIELEKNKLEKY